MFDVFIVGAGPTGLTLACECIRYNLSFKIIEAQPQRSHLSKALAIWSGTQEMLAAMGLLESFQEHSQPLKAMNLFGNGKALAKVDLSKGVESCYPQPIDIPQYESESILEKHINESKNSVEYSTTLVEFKQHDDHVSCHIKRPDESMITINAKALCACDGARSTIRKQLEHEQHVTFPGITEPENFILCDAEIKEKSLIKHEAYVSWKGTGAIVLFPVTQTTWRVFAQRKNKNDNSTPTLNEVQTAINHHGHTTMTLENPSWLSAFHVNERYASCFQNKRVFLLGDAAHIHSPAGGQGMNTGMQDAYNLAWKLHYLCKKWDDALAQSYHDERHPVAAAVVRGASQKIRFGMSNGFFMRILKSIIVPIVANIPSVQKHIARDLSETLIHYKDSSLNQKTAMARSVRFAPGTRLRDCKVSTKDNKAISLWHQLLKPNFTLIIFLANHKQNAIESLLKQKPKSVRCIVITTQQSLEINHPEIDVFYDTAQTAHRYYKITKGGWILTRPDQFVAGVGSFSELPLLPEHNQNYK